MGRKIKDITGKKFGCLMAIEPTDERVSSNGCVIWKFKCDCGAIHYANGNAVRFGQIKSCGCLERRRHEKY